TGDPQRAYARVKSTLIATLLGEQWSVASTFRYISAVDETCTGRELGIAGLCSKEGRAENELDSVMYVDVQGSYRPPQFDDKLTVSLGVQNLTNVDPPTCLTCPLNGFDATAYDPEGTFFYVRATFRSENFFDGSFLDTK